MPDLNSLWHSLNVLQHQDINLQRAVCLPTLLYWYTFITNYCSSSSLLNWLLISVSTVNKQQIPKPTGLTFTNTDVRFTFRLLPSCRVGSWVTALEMTLTSLCKQPKPWNTSCKPNAHMWPTSAINILTLTSDASPFKNSHHVLTILNSHLMLNLSWKKKPDCEFKILPYLVWCLIFLWSEGCYFQSGRRF